MARVIVVACAALLIAACGGGRDRTAEQLLPEKLYERGHRSLMAGDFRGAVRYYEEAGIAIPDELKGQ